MRVASMLSAHPARAISTCFLSFKLSRSRDVFRASLGERGALGTAVKHSRPDRRLVARWLIALMAATFACTAVFAQSRPWTLDRYQHTAWLSKDGAPTGNKSIVQSTDGFLWIGADKGLYRFDGSSFERIKTLDGADLSDGLVMPLLAGRDGSLWVESDKDGLIRFKDGQAKVYTPKDGLKTSWDLNQMVMDNEGNPWLLAQFRVLRLEQGHWMIQDQDLIDQHIPIVSLFIDHRDGVWAGTADSLYYRAAGQKKFALLERRGYVLFMAERSDGSIWVSYLKNIIERWDLRKKGPILAPGIIHPVSDGYIAFDPQGGLWINGLGGGVQHISGSALDADPTLSSIDSHLELFNKAKGLSGDYVWPSLVDSEGNIWFGTNAGIDRFSRSNFAVSKFPESGHYFSLTPGKHGEIFAGSTGAPVMEIDGDKVRSFNIGLPMLASYTDSDNNVYMAGPTGLWEIRGSAEKLLAKMAMDTYVSVVSLVKDNNTFWLGINGGKRSGLYSWRDGEFHPFYDIHAGSSKIFYTPNQIFKDSQGRLWMGQFGGVDVHVLDQGVMTSIASEKTNNVGISPNFTESDGRLWVGGGGGLGYIADKQLKFIHFEPGQQIKNITGLAFAFNGDLWVHALDGVYQIFAGDLHHGQVDPNFVVPYRKFDALDGVLGAPDPNNGHPTVVRTTDGRLWFSSSDGVAWLDPSQLVSNLVPPPVVITSIQADGKEVVGKGVLQVPPATQSVRLTFSVPSLTMPERVRVKVRLQGLGNEWRDVGSQREVTYNNLLPNEYHFDVIASNNSGVWNKIGASVAFNVLPTFYQAIWFKMICALLAALVIWTGLALRFRYAHRKALIKMEARHAERERIARELHDTLLQSMHGMLIKVDLWARSADLSDAQRAGASTIEELMRSAITEGRDSIKVLRQDEGGDRDFISSLSVAGENICRSSNIFFSLQAQGKIKPINSHAFDEILAIVREALLNACLHAKGNTVEMLVIFSFNALEIEISDDGIGMTVEHMEQRQREGHWGIRGMQERVARLSGRCSIASTPGVGTTVSIWVPRKAAYA